MSAELKATADKQKRGGKNTGQDKTQREEESREKWGKDREIFSVLASLELLTSLKASGESSVVVVVVETVGLEP